MDSFYLTIFSNENDVDFTDFTTILQQPIVLNSQKNWFVAVASFYHPPVLSIIPKDSQDVIRFQSYSGDTTAIFNSQDFIQNITKAVKNPGIYTKKYVEDFYNIENYKNFDSNDNFFKSKTEYNSLDELTKNNDKFLVTAWNIATATRKANDTRIDLPNAFKYTFASNFNYTLKQLIYTIVSQTYAYLAVEIAKLKKKEDYVSVEEHIFHVVRSFVLKLYNARKTYFTKNSEGQLTYQNIIMNIHCNLISSQYFNQKLAKIIFTKFVTPMVIYQGDVPYPYKYFPVQKNTFTEINFKITDENFRQLFFIDDSSKMCMILHFKTN